LDSWSGAGWRAVPLAAATPISRVRRLAAGSGHEGSAARCESAPREVSLFVTAGTLPAGVAGVCYRAHLLLLLSSLLSQPGLSVAGFAPLIFKRCVSGTFVFTSCSAALLPLRFD